MTDIDIKLPINIDRDDVTLVITKWVDDGIDGPGFYLFKREAGETNFTQGADYDNNDDGIYIIDDDVPLDTVVSSGFGHDTILITKHLNTSISILDQDGYDGDIIQFDAGFTATSIHQRTNFLSIITEYLINFVDPDGNAHTISIFAPKKFKYRLGEDGDLLDFDAFNTQDHKENGFRINQKPELTIIDPDTLTGAIDENTTAQTPTGITFTAIDEDADQTLIITIYESDGQIPSTLFEAIEDPDVANGYKLVSKAADSSQFDAESDTTSYDLVISVDDGDFEVTSNVSVVVRNINDNAPVLTISGPDTLTGAIDENTTAQTPTGITFTVSDEDVEHTLTFTDVTPFLTVPDDVNNGTDEINTLDLSDASTRHLIQGGDQNDTITASVHGDVIIGGYGADTINLGNGADVVVHRFLSADGQYTNRDGGDVINDFEIGTDKLLLVDENNDGPLANWAEFINATDAANGVKFDVISDLNYIKGLIIYIGQSGTVDGEAGSTDAGAFLTINFNDSDVSVQSLFGDTINSNTLKETSETKIVTNLLFGEGASIDVTTIDDFTTDYEIAIL